MSQERNGPQKEMGLLISDSEKENATINWVIWPLASGSYSVSPDPPKFYLL